MPALVAPCVSTFKDWNLILEHSWTWAASYLHISKQSLQLYIIGGFEVGLKFDDLPVKRKTSREKKLKFHSTCWYFNSIWLRTQLWEEREIRLCSNMNASNLFYDGIGAGVASRKYIVIIHFDEKRRRLKIASIFLLITASDGNKFSRCEEIRSVKELEYFLFQYKIFI